MPGGKLIIFMILAVFAPPIKSQFDQLSSLISYFRPLSLMRDLDSNDTRSNVDPNLPILDFIGLVNLHGYPAEEHPVTTSDGYKLRVHRIPGSPRSPKAPGKPVVFLQHGVFSSSDIFVLHGPKSDLAFILADSGYDVWLGNARGNTYSRAHVQLSPDRDSKFWQFSYHETAIYDVPASIDYILGVTNRRSVVFIGHSLGATIGFAMLASRPEYNPKVRLLVSLAVVAFYKKPQGIIRTLEIHERLATRLMTESQGEVYSQNVARASFYNTTCAEGSPMHDWCVLVSQRFLAVNPDLLDSTRDIPSFYSHYPAGTSARTVLHTIQNLMTRDFRMYDYGEKENMKIYNQRTPPRYNLKNVIAPTVIFYGKADVVSPPEDSLELAKYLPNVILIEGVPHRDFNHLNFLWSINIRKLLYNRLIKIIQHYTQ